LFVAFKFVAILRVKENFFVQEMPVGRGTRVGKQGRALDSQKSICYIHPARDIARGCLKSVSENPMTTYREVNAAWPTETPVPTPHEAMSGVKRLLRRAHRLAVEDGALPKGTRLRRYRFKTTSGRRVTWPRRGVWYVNPNENRRAGGWPEIVHSVSHWAQRHYWPNEDPHGPRHVWIEKVLADYAIKNFLDGQLKRPEKAKPDPADIRRERVQTAIKRWQSKLRRAETALRKLRKREAYYDRRSGDTGVSQARA
jgi:hypothetical protein